MIHREPWSVNYTPEFLSTWGKDLGYHTLISISRWLMAPPGPHNLAGTSSCSSQGQPYKKSHKWGWYEAKTRRSRGVTKIVKDIRGSGGTPPLSNTSFSICISATGLTFPREMTVERSICRGGSSTGILGTTDSYKTTLHSRALAYLLKFILTQLSWKSGASHGKLRFPCDKFNFVSFSVLPVSAQESMGPASPTVTSIIC